jgi:hypothetical protein
MQAIIYNLCQASPRWSPLRMEKKTKKKFSKMTATQAISFADGVTTMEWRKLGREGRRSCRQEMQERTLLLLL